MRKIVCLFVFLGSLSPVYSQNLAGLDRWITGFPPGEKTLGGRPITACVIEPNGALIVIDRQGVPVRINLIQPIDREALTARLGAVLGSVLSAGELVTEKWNIAVRECEIDFGLHHEIAVTLRLSSFRFRLNAATVLELAGRLEADPVFRQPAPGAAFACRLRFRDIRPDTGRGDVFPGWPECVRRLAAWFQAGLDAGNREVRAIVLDASVMSRREKREQTRIVLSKDTRTNVKIGLNIDYFMSNIVSAEDFHIHLRPAAYHLLQPMAFVSWRNLGDPSWLARPFQITVGLGGFFELNAGYFTRYDRGDDIISTYPLTNGSFIYACGPALRVEFSGMIPRIVDNRYADDLFGIGLELLTVVNIPYFFPDYFYEYFLNQYVNFIFHLWPGDAAGLDAIIGINFALQTLGLDEASGVLVLGKFALSAGVRLRFDLHTAYLSNELFE